MRNFDKSAENFSYNDASMINIELQPYKKIVLVKNWFCVKIPVFPSFFFFFLFFPLLKTIGKFKK
ncbi:hypothetical protein FWK35_00004421 [Aphis craccivora]|uniref:Uncharacterized protein n=1 Tax=Aphis craccivora TaxID=307492 RepID=A0A6G0ZSJ8_APHCR|nr:hypothetical protein FWK35_00004421 [Aphis craccivora]